MAKSILQNPQRRANLRHYGHDLSFRRDFTCSCGQLLPVMWDFINPNESIRINDSVFARTQPLLSAAFARCTLHTYYFFVPIYQLDPYFENAFYGINDFHDSLTPVGTSPLLMNGQSPKGPIVSQSIKLSNIKRAMFSVNGTPGAGTTGFYINDVANDLLYIFGSENPEVGVDEFGIPVPYNIVRLLDLIGYGSEWLSQITGDKIGVSPNDVATPSVNVLPLQAYQKIFFDFFRNTQYTSNNPFAYNAGFAMKSDSSTGAGPGWSYDYSSIYTPRSGGKGVNIYNGLFKLRYHPMKKDFFTSIQPTPLFDVNDDVQGYNPTAPSGGLNSYVLSAYGVQLQGLSGDQTLTKNSNFGVTTKVGTQLTFDSNESVSVLWPSPVGSVAVSGLQQLRLMYAYDKLLQITGRAGKHIDDQTEAHFGVRPTMDTNEVIYLGAHHTPLRIGEVIATADGSAGDSSSTLGQIAGRGLASSGRNRTINYRTKRHGILMAIFSIVPDIDYKDNGLDIRLLRNSIMQWPRPVFDNLGMQPLYTMQSSGVYSQLYDTSILGWQYRYSEEKLSYDKVNGAFLYTLAGWVPSIVFGQFGTTPDSSFYVPPTYLDSIFALSFVPPRLKGTINGSEEIDHFVLFYNADGSGENPFLTSHLTCEKVYERDPFLVCMDFDYKKSSWMSTYSLPNL